jgi:hypothetical protein
MNLGRTGGFGLAEKLPDSGSRIGPILGLVRLDVSKPLRRRRLDGFRRRTRRIPPRGEPLENEVAANRVRERSRKVFVRAETHLLLEVGRQHEPQSHLRPML